MDAYIINLERSPDRRAHITDEVRRTGVTYEIVRAVDGRTLNLDDPALVDPLLASRCPFPAGAAGCALSHLSAYRKMLDDGRDHALILEDDVELPTDLNELAEEVATHLTGAEAALLNFGSYPPGPLRIGVQGSVELDSSRLLALPIDARQLVNAGAYLITSRAAARMLENLLPIRATADDWRFFYEQGMFDRIRCVVPQPVAKSPKFESTIGMYSLGTGIKARVAAPLVRHKIPVLHQAIRRRRQRIIRKWDQAEVVDVPFLEKPSRL